MINTSRFSLWFFLLALLGLSMVPLTATADGNHAHQSQGQALPVPAEPDTLVARLVLPEGVQQPAAVSFEPDTLTIGQMAWLELKLPGGVNPDKWAASLQGMAFSTEGLHLDASGPVLEVAENLVRVPVRTMQINPFRIEVGPLQTDVVLVDLMTSGVQETAGIRDPRRWGWNTWTLALVALVITVLALLVFWAWTARKVVNQELEHWPVAPPAWLAASRDLANLLEEGILDRGDSRLFQDQLASIARRYVADRYRIKANEMTPPEIARAGVQRGFPQAEVQPLAGLLEKWDSARFDPSSVSSSEARRWARDFMGEMARTRIVPRYTSVSANVLLSAEKSWAHLETELLSSPLAHPIQDYAPETGGAS